MRAVEHQTENIRTSDVSEYVGRSVIACFVPRNKPGDITRNDFRTQISVAGELEGKGDAFRILVNDGTFIYFEAKDLSSVVHREQRPSRNGAVATFFL